MIQKILPVGAFILCLGSALLSGPSAVAWGGRGHHSICDAAVFLVKEKGLREFLQMRPHVMGHLCNIPDIYWRNLGPEVGKQGNASHYVDPEILGTKIEEIPLDYSKIVEKFTGADNKYSKGKIFSVPQDFGSNWWRADQFYRRATTMNKEALKEPPKNSKEEQDDKFPFNVAAHDFYVNLGLMGHFVGDNGQPLHSCADYDGYDSGHGGIHGFYEDAVVGALPYNLVGLIVEEAKSIEKYEKKSAFLKEKSVVEKMRALAVISHQDLEKIFQLDKVSKPSVAKQEKGMTLKTAAERESSNDAVEKFRPLIIAQMARSAALLAQLWDQAYVQVGSPKLTKYRSYTYPLTPDFVAPDYTEIK